MDRFGASLFGAWLGGRRSGVVVLALLAWAVPSLVWAQKVPLGDEFLINTYTTGFQGSFKGPIVASDTAGNFVVVWEAEDYPYGAFARQFDSDGTPRGPQFQVNTNAYYPEDEPADNPVVASDAAENFVVAWDSEDCGDSDGVCVRQFDSSGTPREGRN